MSRENYRQSRKKQQLRRPRELNEKSEIALWFLESYGLKLSFLTVQEVAINEMHSLEFDQPSANDGDQENLEIFARQILCQWWALPWVVSFLWEFTKVLFDQTKKEWT